MIVHPRLATPTGILRGEWEACRPSERRLLATWQTTKAGDDDGRPWWPWAIRRIPTPVRLELASDHVRDQLWEEFERRRVAGNLAAFVNDYGHVQAAGGDAPEPFILWPEQIDALAILATALRIIILKARQLGLTWLALHYGIWLQGFNPRTANAKIMALSKNGEEASKLLARARRIVQLLPAYLRPAEDRVTHGSLRRFKLEHRGTMISLTSNPAAARSETARLALLDEAAFVRNRLFEPTHTAVQPSLGHYGQEIVLSTGNGPAEVPGDGQGYAKLWQQARAGESDFVPIFLPDSVHPMRTPAWRARERRRYLSDEAFEAEHPETEEQALAGAQGDKVYRPDGVNKAVALGRLLDAEWGAGTIAPPDGGRLVLGQDHGESTHWLVIWPLERGGIYVTAEIVAEHEEVGEVTERFLEQLDAWPGWDTWSRRVKDNLAWFDEARYDSAGAQSNRTFGATVRRRRPLFTTTAIAFNDYKRESVAYLRRLFTRTAEDETTGVIAISPACKVLIRQLRGLEWPEKGGDLPDKVDDHGPDALVAGVAPIARRYRATQENAK